MTFHSDFKLLEIILAEICDSPPLSPNINADRGYIVNRDVAIKRANTIKEIADARQRTKNGDGRMF